MGKIYYSYSDHAKDTAITCEHLFLITAMHINDMNLSLIQGLHLQKHTIIH